MVNFTVERPNIFIDLIQYVRRENGLFRGARSSEQREGPLCVAAWVTRVCHLQVRMKRAQCSAADVHEVG